MLFDRFIDHGSSLGDIGVLVDKTERDGSGQFMSNNDSMKDSISTYLMD